LALGVKAQATPALLVGGDAVIGDKVGHPVMIPHLV
jgi:hypothetical protein